MKTESFIYKRNEAPDATLPCETDAQLKINETSGHEIKKRSHEQHQTAKQER